MSINLADADTSMDCPSYFDIVKKVAEQGGYLWTGIESEELLDLEERLKSDNLALPEEYALFLRQMNGFYYPGKMLRGLYLFGLAWTEEFCDLETVNRDMRAEYPDQMKSRILIGQSSNNFFAYNPDAEMGRNYERLTNNFSIEQSYLCLTDLLTTTMSLRNMLAEGVTIGKRLATPTIQ